MHTAYDRAANQATSFLRYEKWCDGGLVATELQRFRLQYSSLPEFGHLLADAGFADISVTADHRDDHRPGPGSRVWTFHAVRAALAAVQPVVPWAAGFAAFRRSSPAIC